VPTAEARCGVANGKRQIRATVDNVLCVFAIASNDAFLSRSPRSSRDGTRRASLTTLTHVSSFRLFPLIKPKTAAVSTETRAAMTDKEKRRQKRHTKIRAKLSGTAERPRISVYRSNQHTYVQVIDDENQKTLCAIGTMSSSIKEVVGKEEWKTKTVDAARAVGAALGATMMEKGIKTAVFDRGGFVYHGRVKAVAEACREAGVEF
jgi:large subunit ribosomal protein L18